MGRRCRRAPTLVRSRRRKWCRTEPSAGRFPQWAITPTTRGRPLVTHAEKPSAMHPAAPPPDLPRRQPKGEGPSSYWSRSGHTYSARTSRFDGVVRSSGPELHHAFPDSLHVGVGVEQLERADEQMSGVRFAVVDVDVGACEQPDPLPGGPRQVGSARARWRRRRAVGRRR